MNAPEITFEATDHGFYGCFRLPHQADRTYVSDEKGNRILFATASEAKCEAADAYILNRYGTIRGERCAPTGARARAEALFDPEKLRVVKQRGKSRRVQVERVG